jgi:hypothetical protein
MDIYVVERPQMLLMGSMLLCFQLGQEILEQEWGDSFFLQT